jgi:MraZ protein
MEQAGALLEQAVRGQGVFVGKHTHALDPKKRLTIPSGWRMQVGEPNSLYVLPDIHAKCLGVFPAGEMVRRIEKLRSRSLADQTARQFARVLASQSDLVEWDAQGRIRIKDELLEAVDLVDQVVMVGAFERFELWSPANIQAIGVMDPKALMEAAQYVGF